MSCRALALGFMTVLFSASASGSDTIFVSGQPHFFQRGALEIGSFLIHQRDIRGISETGYYAPLKWTGFHSDTLDWKFEAAASYFSKRGDDWRSFVAAPGFRYKLDDNTTVTPFVRLGFARARADGETRFAFGGDIMMQRIFTLAPGASHGAHRFIVAEAQAGFMAYEGNDPHASARYGFVIATAAYDWAVWTQQSPGAHGVGRAKLGLGLEGQFGEGKAVDWLFLANGSLRSEAPDTGRLLHKIDVSVGVGDKRQHRLGVGYTRGF